MKTFIRLMLEYIKKKWWYCVLLLISSIYVFCNRYDVYNMSELNAVNIIFIVWLGLLLLPLLSEVEIMGIKIKKDIEEVKSNIKALGFQITELKLSNNNSNVTNNYLNGELPTKEDLQRYTHNQANKVGEERVDYITNYDNIGDSDVSNQSVYLFKVRYILERLITNLCDKYDSKSQRGMKGMLEKLRYHEVLDNKDIDLMHKIINITNRGIHGEIISDDYMQFIKNVFPNIKSNLETELFRIESLYYNK